MFRALARWWRRRRGAPPAGYVEPSTPIEGRVERIVSKEGYVRTAVHVDRPCVAVVAEPGQRRNEGTLGRRMGLHAERFKLLLDEADGPVGESGGTGGVEQVDQHAAQVGLIDLEARHGKSLADSLAIFALHISSAQRKQRESRKLSLLPSKNKQEMKHTQPPTKKLMQWAIKKAKLLARTTCENKRLKF